MQLRVGPLSRAMPHDHDTAAYPGPSTQAPAARSPRACLLILTVRMQCAVALGP